MQQFTLGTSANPHYLYKENRDRRSAALDLEQKELLAISQTVIVVLSKRCDPRPFKPLFDRAQNRVQNQRSTVNINHISDYQNRLTLHRIQSLYTGILKI